MATQGRGTAVRQATAAMLLVAALSAGGTSASADTTGGRAGGVRDKPKAAPILFTQNATSGTLTPDPTRPSEYQLALSGAAAQTTWFTERPARRAGVYQTPVAIKTINFAGQKAPNAVISLLEGEASQDTLAVTLRDPAYDEQQATLRYRVKPLDSVRRTRLNAYADALDKSLPESFGPTAVFIDDVAPTDDSTNCIVHIEFKRNNKMYFHHAQDLIPDDSSKGLWRYPLPGRLYTNVFDAKSGGAGSPIYCRAGFAFGFAPDRVDFFVYLNNPAFHDSDWGCPTVAAGWKCTMTGNTSGQPLKVTATFE